MTTEQTIRNLKGAVSDAEDTINDLIRQAEDLEAGRWSLEQQLDGAEDEVSTLQAEVARLEDRLEAEKRAGRIL